MSLPDALYHADGDVFVPTPLCIGPWSPHLQHGGPPAGLIAAAMDGFGDEAEAFELLRLHVSLVRPVPLVPLRVVVEPIRLGGRAHWLSARLLGPDDELYGVAQGLRIRRVSLELPPAHTPALTRPAPPESVPEMVFPFFPTEIAFHRAIDVRVVEGTWPVGPIAAWLRLRVPLVAGTPTAPFARVITLCDAINGVTPALTVGRFSFPNADLSVRLLRRVQGPWIGIRGRSRAHANGAGLVQGSLFDGQGEVGSCAESLVVSG